MLVWLSNKMAFFLLAPDQFLQSTGSNMTEEVLCIDLILNKVWTPQTDSSFPHLSQVLRHVTPQDEFALACASKAFRSASIFRRVIPIKRMSGISGRDQRKIIEEDDDAKIAAGKRPSAPSKKKLHPAIRRLILETTPCEMAERVLAHLIDVVTRYHEEGAILKSAHSHFVALCYAAEELGLTTTLKFTTKAFIKRLYSALPCQNSPEYRTLPFANHDLAKDIYQGVLCTIVLGRYLTHPRGFEKGWEELFNGLPVHQKQLYPHGNYYRHFEKDRSSPYRNIVHPSPLMLLKNFHFKPGGRFFRMMGVGSTKISAELIGVLKRLPDPTSEELTLTFAELRTDHHKDGDHTSFLSLFVELKRAYPNVAFSEEQLERIGMLRSLDSIERSKAYVFREYVLSLARLIAVMGDAFPNRCVAEVEKFTMEPMLELFELVHIVQLPEFIQIIVFAKERCQRIFLQTEQHILHYMDNTKFLSIDDSIARNLRDHFPGVRTRISRSLYEILDSPYAHPESRPYFEAIAAEILQKLHKTVRDYPSYLGLKRVIPDMFFVEKKTGRAWDKLNIDRIFAFLPTANGAKLLLTWLIEKIAIPALGELKRQREVASMDEDDEEDRYEKRIRID